MGCANVLSREKAEEVESSECVNMHALSTETHTDNGTSCATCSEIRGENKVKCCSHNTLLHRS